METKNKQNHVIFCYKNFMFKKSTNKNNIFVVIKWKIAGYCNEIAEYYL